MNLQLRTSKQPQRKRSNSVQTVTELYQKLTCFRNLAVMGANSNTWHESTRHMTDRLAIFQTPFTSTTINNTTVWQYQYRVRKVGGEYFFFLLSKIVEKR